MSKPKKKRDQLAAQRRRRQKRRNQQPPAAAVFDDDEGLHFLILGQQPPDPQTLDEMTRRYQEEIRNSPLWEDMVRQFGPQRAEELLRQCRAEMR